MKSRSALIFALVGLVSLACGQAVKYANTTTTVRAGIGLLDANKTLAEPGPENLTPYVWYNLDRLPVGKPNGWVFQNPAAPSVQKSDKTYWEIRISQTSDTQLAQFDVLCVPIYQNISLSPFERERLRRFVDQGGLLWIDLTSTNLSVNQDKTNGFPIPFQVNATMGSVHSASDLFHPLLSFPNQLTASDVSLTLTTASGSIATPPLSGGSADPLLLPVSAAGQFESVVGEYDGSNAYTGSIVSVAKIGHGHVLVTSRGVAQTLNRGLDSSGNLDLANNGPTADTPFLDRASQAAANLIVNAFYLNSSYPELGAGSRKLGGQPVNLPAPLSQNFKSISSPGDLSNAPTIYKGVMVVVSSLHGIWTVSAYDANPAKDLDGDGNADDGEPDFSLGKPYDLLWHYSFPNTVTQLSAPSCFTVNNPNTGIPRNQVVVVDQTGALYAFDLFNIGAGGLISTAPPSGPAYSYTPATAGSVSANPGAHAMEAVFQDNLLYLVDNEGATPSARLTVLDPNLGTLVTAGGNNWVIGGSAAAFIPEASAAPTIGYIPIFDGSGGVDKVLYVPSLPKPGVTCGVASLFVGAKGEAASYQQLAGNVLRITTRASINSLDIYQPLSYASPDPLSIKLTLVRANGDVYNQTDMNTLFTGVWTQNQGVVDINMTSPLPADVAKIYIDYNVDIGKVAASGNFAAMIRGNINFPDDTGHLLRVMDHVALGPDGTMFVATSSADNSSVNAHPGGAFYAVREEGRGQFKLKYRFDLMDSHVIQVSGGDTTIPSSFRDIDGVSQIDPSLTGDIEKMTFMGGPTIASDQVFVTASGFKVGTSTPSSVLMSFKLTPETPIIPVGDLPNGVQVIQYDYTASSIKSNPTSTVSMQPTQYSYELEQGAANGAIRVDSLMSSINGPMQNAFSSSLPVVLKVPGKPDQVIWPDQVGGRWSPLNWFTVFDGASLTGRPAVAGSTVYLSGTSLLGSLLANAVPVQNGFVAAMSTAQSAGQFISPDSARPWQNEVLQMLYTSPSSIETNPVVLWPQGAGTVADYTTHLLQTLPDSSLPAAWSNSSTYNTGDLAIGSDNKIYYSLVDGNSGNDPTIAAAGNWAQRRIVGTVAGEGVMGAWGNDATYAYQPSVYLVCDQGRLIEVDSAGNPIWSLESTYQTGPQGDLTNAGQIHKLLRPSRAYYLDGGDILIVDSGAQRVVRVDRFGREVRSIDSFILDPVYRPDGYQASEANKLADPADVVTWSGYVLGAGNLLNSPNALEYWTHYLVADRGNRRLLELVDRYVADPSTRQILGPVAISGVPQLGVLYGHSANSASGKGFEYGSLARVYVPGVSPHYAIAAGIGPEMPSSGQQGISTISGTTPDISGTGNSGIVLFDGPTTIVINQYDITSLTKDWSTSAILTADTDPVIPANMFWNDDSGSFASDAISKRLSRKISGLNSLTMQTKVDTGGNAYYTIMFTDTNGVFELEPEDHTNMATTAWRVNWMLPKEAYSHMRGLAETYPLDPGSPNSSNVRSFHPTFAKRMANGSVLIVNSIEGTTYGNSAFSGEVLEVSGLLDPPVGGGSVDTTVPGFWFTKKNLGFGTSSIRVSISSVQGARGLQTPLFAIRK
ncbi:MAG: hypothetical protein JSS72_05270 [Armatimonadetes bacterium]|nr:hypothetical protein [Armatimonadota bacterium]